MDYSGLGCQCRLNRGGILFRRTRYQQGSLLLEERKRGSAVWVYRWWENDITGKPIRRKGVRSSHDEQAMFKDIQCGTAQASASRPIGWFQRRQSRSGKAGS